MYVCICICQCASTYTASDPVTDVLIHNSKRRYRSSTGYNALLKNSRSVSCVHRQLEQNHERLLPLQSPYKRAPTGCLVSLNSVMLLLKYVFTRFKAEKVLSDLDVADDMDTVRYKRSSL